jgi:hypothetical protein
MRIRSSDSSCYLLDLSVRATAHELPLERSTSSFHMPEPDEPLQPARECICNPHPDLSWLGPVYPLMRAFGAQISRRMRAAVREETARFGLILPTGESSPPLTGYSR